MNFFGLESLQQDLLDLSFQEVPSNYLLCKDTETGFDSNEGGEPRMDAKPNELASDWTNVVCFGM